MDKLGIAVVGCGAMAQMMHLPNIVKHPELHLLWCCDVNEDTLKTASEKFSPKKKTTDAKDIAADPACDIVLLCTTQKVRLPLIDLFAGAGKHLFVEKPIADTFDEMQKILKIADRTRVKFTVGHNRRVAPAVKEALRVLDKHRTNPVSPAWRWQREGDDCPKLAGDSQTMVMLRVNDDYWSWKKWAFSHGALINEMTHFADLACAFISSNPVRVSTVGGKDANHIVNIEYADGSLACIFATAFGSFGYPKELVEIYHNGAVIVLDHLMEMRVAGVVDEPFRKMFPVVGDRQPWIEAQGIEGYYQRVEATQQEAIKAGDNSILPGWPDKGHYGLLDDLVQCIKEDREPACSPRVAALPTAVILRALKSEAMGGVPVKILESDYSIQEL